MEDAVLHFAVGALLCGFVASACSDAGELEFARPNGSRASTLLAPVAKLAGERSAALEPATRVERTPSRAESEAPPSLEAASADRRAELAIRRRFRAASKQRSIDAEAAHESDFSLRAELERDSIRNRIELELADAELRAADPLANLRWAPRDAARGTTDFSALYAGDPLEDLAVESAALERDLLRDTTALLATKHARGDENVESGPYAVG